MVKQKHCKINKENLSLSKSKITSSVKALTAGMRREMKSPNMY